MKRFAYLDAETLAAASGALAETGNSVAKSGGTDLMDLLKERILEPTEVVNLRGARRDENQGEISALATLAEVAEDEWVKVDFPALHHAAAVAATPQIRNVGTVGGNLCQHTRCWYFRNKSFECFKRGTGDCSAVRDGAQNRYHAIFPHDRCASAYPGNLAPALIALGARVACVHPDGDRVMDVELLYEEPSKGKGSDTVLRDGELVRAVLLQPSAMTRRSTYKEFRERLSFDFAAASVAVALDLRDGMVKEARIVCGGVAPTPYRARAAEKALLGNGVDAAVAADAAVADALPLEQNGYKVPILRTLIRQALEELKS